MQISILTLFPQMFVGPLDYSIIKRAKDQNLVNIQFFNLREYSTDSYGTVDDKPYGGGLGMVLRVDVIDKAINDIESKYPTLLCKKILLDPKGKQFTQKLARKFSEVEHLLFICGHYEGVDARVNKLVDEIISVGPFVLTGGEIAAMTIVDASVRLLPRVFKKPDVTSDESFDSKNLLEYPQFTRPEEYKGMKVPGVLLSGNHRNILEWKSKQKVPLRAK